MPRLDVTDLSWVAHDGGTACCAAKAAQWSLTNGIRGEPAVQGTLVTGLADQLVVDLEADLSADPGTLYPRVVGA